MAVPSTRPLTYAALERRALRLPEVEASTSYGTRALKVRGKLMVRLKEDNATVVLRTTWEERERLLAAHPDVFFLTEHYRNHPRVLMTLAACTLPMLEEVLEAAWRAAAPPSLAKRHANASAA